MATADRFRLSRLLRQKLADAGVPAEAVLRRAGLPPGIFEQDKPCVSTQDLFALYQAVEEFSPEPAVGLKLGAEDRIERYDPVALAALGSRSFRDAIGRAAKYKQVICPENIRLVAGGPEESVRFQWTLACQSEPAVLTDQCFAWLLAIGRQGTGRPVVPLRVEFKRKPAFREVYERHFGCPVVFQAVHNALVFRPADLDRPFLTHNPDLVALIAPQLEQELAWQRAQGGIREQVGATLKRMLAGRRPDLREVARELAQSARTLQRRLAEDGATFQAVLEEARSELARTYLLHSDLELAEVAYLLGYEDANSFFRAFQRWEGMPPGRWRSSRRTA